MLTSVKVNHFFSNLFGRFRNYVYLCIVKQKEQTTMEMLEIDKIKESKEGKALSTLTDSLNSFSWNPETFAKAVQFEHRTLQQSLMRTMVKVIRAMAEFPYDGRNEASVKLCKEIVESGILDQSPLPLI